MKKYNSAYTVTSCGFTLVEIMAATIIIGIIAAGVGSGLYYSQKSQMTSRARHAAVFTASSLLEEARAASKIDSTPKIPQSSVRWLQTDYSLGSSKPSPPLNWDFDGKSYNMSAVITNNADDFTTITVTIEWQQNPPITMTANRYIGPR